MSEGIRRTGVFSDSPSASPRFTAYAGRVANEGIVMDGFLTESEWNEIPSVADFLQKEPEEGNLPREHTEIRFCYDDDALYIGARMSVLPASGILSTMGRRDKTGNSERIIISLDTFGDRRTAYSFGVTASGARFDYYHASDEEFDRSYSFDPVWEAFVQADSLSWTTEMRIPFSQLRFIHRSEQVWGLNINRFIPSTQEDLYWVLIPKRETGWSSRFGKLLGIKSIPPTRRIELLPYMSSNTTIQTNRDRMDPFDDGINLAGRAGVDAKMGIGSNLTLDATINPDFGQVEADPAEVNLSAYETYFEERRPFFTEGSQLFNGNGPGYFYSRRIGAPPHGLSEGLPHSDYIEMIPSTTILGAGKVTGRLPSGLSIGALTAVTANEYAESYDLLDTEYRRTRVEPLTGFGVIRLQQEFGVEASTVGATITGVQRDLKAGDALNDILSRRAYSGGVDWDIRFNGGEYVLSGYGGLSEVGGTPGAITRIQRNSAHLFQRPDATHVRLDTARASLSGYTAGIEFEKNSGTHWLWNVEAECNSPGFEINDAGQLRAADGIATGASLQYRETVPGALFHSYSFHLSPYADWNYGGIRRSLTTEFIAQQTWKNFWSTYFRVAYETPTLNDYLTRGGPLMRTGARWDSQFILDGNYSSPTNWEVYTTGTKDEDGGWAFWLGGSVTFRPGAQWELSLEALYRRQVDARQYLAALPGGRQETYGNRYVFATSDRGQVLARFRLSYAFTPDLTLELYAEPFAAGVAFRDFGELSAPRSASLRLYGRDGTTLTADEKKTVYTVVDGDASFSFPNPDFRFLSLRSNLVLRWEWMRGSTFYLVWQQDRSGRGEFESLAGPGDLLRTFETFGTHYLALKLAYWLPVP